MTRTIANVTGGMVPDEPLRFRVIKEARVQIVSHATGALMLMAPLLALCLKTPKHDIALPRS